MASNPNNQSGQSSKTSSKKKNKIIKRIANLIIFIGVWASTAIVCTILGFHFHDVIDGAQISYSIQGVHENLISVPFTDITFAYPSSGCPLGYENITSIGYWPGTQDFCDL